MGQFDTEAADARQKIVGQASKSLRDPAVRLFRMSLFAFEPGHHVVAAYILSGLHRGSPIPGARGARQRFEGRAKLALRRVAHGFEEDTAALGKCVREPLLFPREQVGEVVEALLGVSNHLSELADPPLGLFERSGKSLALLFYHPKKLTRQAPHATVGCAPDKLVTGPLRQVRQRIYQLSPISLTSAPVELFKSTDFEDRGDGTPEPGFEHLAGKGNRRSPFGFSNAICFVQ